jgi:hypothetical protein
MDTVGLWSHMLHTLARGPDRRRLLSHQGEDARNLSNVFQYLLDYSNLGGRTRNRIIKAMIRLCKASEVYPEGIPVISVTISWTGLAGGGLSGGSSTVYRGTTGDGFDVAVKFWIMDAEMDQQERIRRMRKVKGSNM